MAEHATNPGKRKAQHLLASEVLELVHGKDVAKKTRAEHEGLRNPTLATFSLRTPTAGSCERAILPSSLVLNTPFSRILYHAGVVSSKSEGARLIAKGGAYVAVSSQKGTAGDASLAADSDKLAFVQLKDQSPADVQQFVANGMLVFRIGKWKVRVVEVVEDADFDAQGLSAPGWDDLKASRSSSV